MKTNKAFTLIELLAVIIILAIIALIATPIIINVVDDVRTQGFKQTALGYYKAAEYIYDEMLMGGKTENVQFTFEDGKQTSSNENYKLEVKGETPQEGLVYLTKEGHIAVSINNNKYCVYVDGNKEVTISEDINHCGYTPVPEGCYSIEREQLNAYIDGQLSNSEEWMTKEYNILSYKIASTSCPKKFDILIIPEKIDGQTVEAINIPMRKNKYFSANDLILPEGLQVIDDAFMGRTNGTNSGIKNVVIPDSVFYIGESSFANNSLTSIVLPSNLKYIGDYAFSYNQLKEVVIPEGVTVIGEEAFSENQLTSITMPNSITSIGSVAFANNQLPDNQAFIYGRNIDGTEDKTTLVSYGGAKRDNIVIPEGVTYIGQSAFARQQITSVTIPEGVTDVGYRSFASNKLATITLPSTLRYIGGANFNDYGAFSGNQLTNITIPNSVYYIGGNAFSDNQLTNVTIPNSVTSIEFNAFISNKLTSVTIPSSVTNIGDQAFRSNQFPNASAITIEGDATRFDSNWTDIGFPAK